MTDEQYNQLVQEYLEEFRKTITEDILSWGELHELESESEPHYSYYFGSMPWPSGKMYVPWQPWGDEEEMENDEAWWSALSTRCNEMVEQVKKLSYMSFEHGEGDPCDLFLTWGYVENDELE